MSRQLLVLLTAIFLLHTATLSALLIAQERADARHDEMKGGIINLYKNQMSLDRTCRGSWM